MPTSGPDYVSWVLMQVWEYRRREPVESILDVGIGWGKYGMLFREFMDGWFGGKRVEAGDREVRLEGIEPERRYRWPVTDAVYDAVHWGKTFQEARPALGRYDVGLLVDVLEHFSDADGEAAIKDLRERCKLLVVITPATFFPQDGVAQTYPHERHLSLWTPERLAGLGALRSGQVFDPVKGGGAVYGVWDRSASAGKGRGLYPMFGI